MSNDTISFADAAKADPQRVFAAASIGKRVVRVIGRRVHLLAEGSWRSYALLELIVVLRCDHCGRLAQRLERVVKYGKGGWFTCCLQCVEWHEARGCPYLTMELHQ